MERVTATNLKVGDSILVETGYDGSLFPTRVVATKSAFAVTINEVKRNRDCVNDSIVFITDRGRTHACSPNGKYSRV